MNLLSKRNSLRMFYFSYWSIIVYLIMVVPYQLKDIYSNFQIGIILFVLIAFKFLSIPLFSKQKISKNFIYSLIGILSVSTLLIPFVYNYFYALVLLGIIIAIVSNYIISYFDMIKVKTYRKYLGSFRVYGSIGGFTLFVLLMLNLDIFYIIFFFIFLFLLSSTIIIYRSKKIYKVKNIDSEKKLFNFSSYYWVIAILLLGVMQFYHSFFGIYLIEYGDYESFDINFLLATGIFFEIIALFVAYKFLKKYDLKNVFLLATFITGIRLICFDLFLDNFYVLIIVQSLHFFTMGLFFPSLLNLIKKYNHFNLNQALQFYNGFVDGLLKSSLLFGLSFLVFQNIFISLGIIIAILPLFYKYVQKV